MALYSHHTHLRTGTVERESRMSNPPRMVTYTMLACGAETLDQIKSNTEDESRVTCPKCSAIVNTRKLAGANARLEKIPKDELGKLKSYDALRSAHKVFIGNEHVGYVAFPAGYGGKWRLYPITLTNDLEPHLSDDRASGSHGLRPKSGRWQGFDSKEEALADAIIYEGEGKLPSMTKVLAETKAWRAEADARMATRRQQDSQRKKELDNVLEGLQSILNRTDANISNFEREAVAGALKRLSPNE